MGNIVACYSSVILENVWFVQVASWQLFHSYYVVLFFFVHWIEFGIQNFHRLSISMKIIPLYCGLQFCSLSSRRAHHLSIDLLLALRSLYHNFDMIYSSKLFNQKTLGIVANECNLIINHKLILMGIKRREFGTGCVSFILLCHYLMF